MAACHIQNLGLICHQDGSLLVNTSRSSSSAHKLKQMLLVGERKYNISFHFDVMRLVVFVRINQIEPELKTTHFKFTFSDPIN